MERTLDDKESRRSLPLSLFALVSLKRASIVSLQLMEEEDAYFQHLLIPTGKIDKEETIISDMNMGMDGTVEMETLANGRK